MSSNLGITSPSLSKNIANVVVNDQHEIKNLVRYLNDVPIEHNEPGLAETVKGQLPFIGIFGAIQAKGWASDLAGGKLLNKDSFIKVKEGYNVLKDVHNSTVGTVTKGFNPLSLESWKSLGKLGAEQTKYVQKATEISSKAKGAVLETAAEAADAAGKTKKAAKLLKKSKNAFEAASTAASGVTKAPGKIASLINKVPGGKGLTNAFKKGGGAFMAVIGGITETLSEVIPAFQNKGFASGMKQIGKSAVKVAADTGGWCVGASVGAAIGSFLIPIPGVGTFIGSMLGGAIGSWATGKVAKAITGKTEMEKFKDEQMDQQAQELAQNPQALQEIASQIAQQAQLEQEQTGKVSENTQKALKDAEAVLSQQPQVEPQVSSTNPFASAA